MAPARKTLRGLGLVEVLVASSILVISVTAIFSLLRVSIKGTERVEEEMLAVSAAQDLLDFLCSIPYSRIPPFQGGNPGRKDVDLASLVGLFESADTQVSRAVRRKTAAMSLEGFDLTISFERLLSEQSVQAQSRSPGGGLGQITVAVRWTSQLSPGKTASRSITLARLVTDDQELDL